MGYSAADIGVMSESNKSGEFQSKVETCPVYSPSMTCNVTLWSESPSGLQL